MDLIFITLVVFMWASFGTSEKPSVFQLFKDPNKFSAETKAAIQYMSDEELLKTCNSAFTDATYIKAERKDNIVVSETKFTEYRVHDCWAIICTRLGAISDLPMDAVVKYEQRVFKFYVSSCGGEIQFIGEVNTAR